MNIAAASSLSNLKQAADRSHEPSMEEILASIRRIIAEDQPVQPKAAAPAPAPAPAASAPLEFRPAPPARPASPTVAELDSAVERLRRALEPIVEKSAQADAARAKEADSVVVKAEAAPKTEAISLTPPPPPVEQPKAEPFAFAPAAPKVEVAAEPAKSAAPAVQIEPPAMEAPAPPVEPEPVASRQFSPFPSLEKAFPGSASVLQRVASDLPVETVRPVAQSASDALSRAELLSQPRAPEPVELADVGDQVDPLLSPTADASVASSFQALATTVLFQDKSMMEDMAREMLRPMLKQWLDDNLPVMVERLVRSEIERVARGGRG